MFPLLLLVATVAITLVLLIIDNDSALEHLLVAVNQCNKVNHEATPPLPPPTPAPSPDATPPPSPSGRNKQAASFEQELTSKLLRRLHT